MSASKIVLDSNIQEISYAPSCKNLVLRTSTCLAFYKFIDQANQKFVNHNNPPKQIARLDSKDQKFDISAIRQIKLLSNSLICVEKEKEKDEILHIFFDIDEKNSNVSILKISRISTQNNVFSLYQNPDTETTYIQMYDGSVKEYILPDFDIHKENPSPELQNLVIFNGKLPSPCSHFSSVVFENEVRLIPSKTYFEI